MEYWRKIRDVVDQVELAGYEIFKEVAMGGGFGKYGLAKHKAEGDLWDVVEFVELP